MKIVNPLYDKAFKYLMENNRLAKKVIEVILDQEIVELSLGQQETIFPDEKRGFTLFRLDFNAIIKQRDGSTKKVLIELQKSKTPTDIQRFRNYLGANYMSKASKTKEDNTESRTLYPLITIYILGHNLDDLPYLAVKVNREVIDVVKNEPVNINSFFIDHLTHESHILQVRRLPEKRRTKLERFLTLFNQAWVADHDYILDLRDVPEEFSDMAKHLQGPVMDNEFRRLLEVEEEIDLIFDQKDAKLQRAVKEKEQAQREKQEAQQEKEKALKEKEEAQKEKEMAMQKEKAANQKEYDMAVKLARNLIKAGIASSVIAKETGLSKEDIERLNN